MIMLPQAHLDPLLEVGSSEDLQRDPVRCLAANVLGNTEWAELKSKAVSTDTNPQLRDDSRGLRVSRELVMKVVSCTIMGLRCRRAQSADQAIDCTLHNRDLI